MLIQLYVSNNNLFYLRALVWISHIKKIRIKFTFVLFEVISYFTTFFVFKKNNKLFF
jgi:hypothetical protein